MSLRDAIDYLVDLDWSSVASESLDESASIDSLLQLPALLVELDTGSEGLEVVVADTSAGEAAFYVRHVLAYEGLGLQTPGAARAALVDAVDLYMSVLMSADLTLGGALAVPLRVVGVHPGMDDRAGIMHSIVFRHRWEIRYEGGT